MKATLIYWILAISDQQAMRGGSTFSANTAAAAALLYLEHEFPEGSPSPGAALHLLTLIARKHWQHTLSPLPLLKQLSSRCPGGSLPVKKMLVKQGACTLHAFVF